MISVVHICVFKAIIITQWPLIKDRFRLEHLRRLNGLADVAEPTLMTSTRPFAKKIYRLFVGDASPKGNWLPTTCSIQAWDHCWLVDILVISINFRCLSRSHDSIFHVNKKIKVRCYCVNNYYQLYYM